MNREAVLEMKLKASPSALQGSRLRALARHCPWG